MADSAGKRRVEDDGFGVPSVWDLEDDEPGGAPLDVARSSEGGLGGEAARVGASTAVGVVPFPFERLEGAARALAGLDERLAERAVRRRWFAAMRRCAATDQGRLCGFAVDVADACLIEWDPLAPGQSRLNGLWVVSRGLEASRLVQRRTRARPPEAEQIGEIGAVALGRWCAAAERGALEVCDRWQGLAGDDRRGLLVFCEALGTMGSWPGLDVEERAVLLGVLSPWLARGVRADAVVLWLSDDENLVGSGGVGA